MAARTHKRINQLPGVNDPFTPKVVICDLRKHRLRTFWGHTSGVQRVGKIGLRGEKSSDIMRAECEENQNNSNTLTS